MTDWLEESELIARAQSGDEQAFGIIHARLVAPIFRFVMLSIHNRDEVEDIVQETFVRAWKFLPRYRDSGKPFRSFLYRIAHNLIIDRARSRRTVSLEEFADADSLPDTNAETPSAIAERNEECLRVREALRELPENRRTVLVLKFIEGYETDEIAEMLEMTTDNVRQLQSRALKELTHILKHEKH